MFRPIATVAAIVSVTAALVISSGRLPAQEVIRLEGQSLSVTPVFEEENRPQAFVGAPPAAMTTVGGDTVVTCVAYSPDGQTLALGDGPNRPICTLGAPPPLNPNGGLIRLIDTKTNRARATLGPKKRAGHEYEVKDLRFSADGTRLISFESDASRDKDRDDAREHFSVWDLAHGGPPVVVAERRQIGTARWREHAHDMAPDGRSLAAVDDQAIACIWDATNGQRRIAVRPAHTPPRSATSVKFSPDSSALAVGFEGGAVVVVDTSSGRQLASLPDDPGGDARFQVDLLAFAPGGHLLASYASFVAEVAENKWIRGSKLRLFDIAEARERSRPHVLDSEMIDCMTFTPDAKALVTGSTDAVVKIWDAATGRERTFLKGKNSGILSLAFSPDGKILASGHRDSVTLWDAASWKERAFLSEMLLGNIDQLAFHPDGRFLISTGLALKIWDVRAAVAPRFDEGHTYEVMAVAYSPDGKSLASGSMDRTVKIWDLAARKPRATLRGHEGDVTAVVYAPDGRTVISGSRDRTVRIWDASQGTERAKLIGHSAHVTSVALSPDGRTIASGGGADPFRVREALDTRPDDSGEVKLWDLIDGRLLATSRQKISPVNAVAFSPDGRTLAIGKEDDTIDLWDRASGQIRTIPWADPKNTGEHGVLCLSYSPDGRWLAAGGRNSSVRIWKATRSEDPPSATLKHGSNVAALAFSPDGNFLAACDWNREIIVWNANTGQELGRVESPTNWFNSLTFSPDGRSLAAGNRDTSISIFAFERAFRPTR
jgi:WD40 repeat protein